MPLAVFDQDVGKDCKVLHFKQELLMPLPWITLNHSRWFVAPDHWSDQTLLVWTQKIASCYRTLKASRCAICPGPAVE